MAEVDSCGECGVPRQIADEHLWLNSGVIVLKSDQLLRMAFVESENLDYLLTASRSSSAFRSNGFLSTWSVRVPATISIL